MARRLSSLDLLPPEAAPFVIEAHKAIRAGNQLDGDILFELNDKLSTLGIEPISRSAFSRQAVKIKAATERLREASAIYQAVKPEMDPATMEENDIVRAEFIKLLIFNLSQGDDLSAKEAMELARGFLATVQAEKLSAERTRKKKEEIVNAAEQAIAAVEAKRGGIGAATKDALLEALRGSIK